MTKEIKSLSESNRHIKTESRREAVERNTRSSSAIEGVSANSFHRATQKMTAREAIESLRNFSHWTPYEKEADIAIATLESLVSKPPLMSEQIVRAVLSEVLSESDDRIAANAFEELVGRLSIPTPPDVERKG